MKNTLPARVRFGVFELDLKTGELCQGEQRILLQEQPFQVLRMLAERDGEIATREEIKKKLWPNDTIVDFDHSINAAIKNLRRALGDSAEEPTTIETIARRGYRLMVPVEWVEPAADSSSGEVLIDGTAAARVQPAVGALAGKTVSHYRVLDIIGGGGMGVVYRAEDLKLGRRVALKFLPEEFGSDPQALERFNREARVASSLDDPNICNIYEFGEHEGRPFMVMQLLEGLTLRDSLADAAEGNALPLGDLLDIGIQVSDGLQAAHEKGIIHRDIKPANIFITTKGVCKILDFGLVKLLEGGKEDEAARGVTLPSASEAMHLTRTGIAMGTASYMSPEQVRGEKLDTRSDLFSFGLILYEMATGRRAFSGDTAAIVHDAILNRAPVAARELNPEVSPGFEAVINKALEKDREKRYQHASEMKADLQRLQRDTGGASNTVDEIPWRVPPVLPWWRSKPALGLGGLILVCMVLAAVFYWWHRLSLAGPSGPRLAHRQITFIGDAYAPAISPDGKSVAYRTTGPGSEQQLMLQDLSSDRSLELLHEQRLGSPKWSPDGSELVLGVFQESRKTRGTLVVSRLGGTPRRVGEGGFSCWLPDGLQIANTAPSRDFGIWLVNQLTGAKKQIPGPEYQMLHDVDCSAKTGMLLLLTETSSKYQIWTMKPDGTEQRELLEGDSGMNFRSPRWSPAGDAIYYFREEGGTTDLVRLPISDRSTGSSVLVNGLEAGDYFTLSADGSQLAYTRTQSHSNLWLVELPAPGAGAEAHAKPLTSGTLLYDHPTISPDGRWVAFTTGSGCAGDISTASTCTESNVYKMTIDGGQPIQLTFFEAAGTSSPAWSPDGRRIAFICDQGGMPKVWVVNADGGTARVLDKTNASDTNGLLAWSPSPEIVYQSPGMHNLRRLNVETQEERPLLANDFKGFLLDNPTLSPDGKKIAIFSNGGRADLGVWVFTLEKFSEELLYRDVFPLGWSADGRFVYAFGYPSGREILQIGFGDSKKPRLVMTMPGGLKTGTVSPDGRKIIVSVGEEKSDVWGNEGF